ncbi:MAG: hypothetical protein ACE5G1_17165 [bacterium]
MVQKTKLLKRIGEVIRHRMRNGVKTKDAIGISIVLHLLVGMAMAWYLVGAVVMTATPHEDTVIEFDLSSQHTNLNSSDQPDGRKMGQASIAAKSAKGSAQNIPDKKAILMASLGDLQALKKTVRFAMQQISSDSTGLSPMHGQISSSALYGLGLESQGSGHGGFSFGVCARPGY